jgi:hypothetical protein
MSRTWPPQPAIRSGYRAPAERPVADTLVNASTSAGHKSREWFRLRKGWHCEAKTGPEQAGRRPCAHVGHGGRVARDWDCHRLGRAADQAIAKLAAPHPRASPLYARLLADPQTLALWDLTGSGPGSRWLSLDV